MEWSKRGLVAESVASARIGFSMWALPLNFSAKSNLGFIKVALFLLFFKITALKSSSILQHTEVKKMALRT